MLIMVWATIASLLIPSHALAVSQGPPIIGLQQRDLDGDDSPDVTIIYCAFATDSDTVYVYDGAGDMRTASDWHEATDFVNDTWVFDVDSDGTAQLIILFAEEDGTSIALLYDDHNADQQVAYEVSGKHIVLQNPDSWSLKIVAEGSWFSPAGYPTQNLLLYFNGSEGVVAGIRDYNRDGVPDYEFWNVLTQAPGAARQQSGSGLWVNKGSTRSTAPDETLFWPFLIAGSWPDIQNKFDLTPFVVVDWQRATIIGTSIGKDVSGYPIEAGYFVLPVSPLTLGELNYANFENPMAYYDLAADRDGWPELHIRMEYFGPFDPFLTVVSSARAHNDIRYSWNQDNSPNLIWDYKVALVGEHLVDSAVQFADLGIKTIPYEALPSWIVEQTWAWGTLVASEGGGYRSSEGIYEWGASYDFQPDARHSNTRVPRSGIALHQYLTGASVEPPDRFFEGIRPSFRGEFAYLEDRPFLYMSPIDRKLHLRHAFKGIWNTGDESEIRVADRDGDGYLDEWLFSRGGSLQRQLNLAPDHLILSDSTAERAEVKRTKVGLALFETLPPHDHDSWQRLGAQLEAHRPSFAPDDFAAMADQFDGPATRIEGAALRNYRPQGDGFRFVLDARPGFRILSDPEGWGSRLTAAGAYAISFDGMAWDVRPATPAAPRASEMIVGEPGQPPRALEWTSIEILLENDGLEDVLELPVYAVLSGPAGEQEVLTTTISLLPAEGSQQVAWDWAPPAAGTWRLRLGLGAEPASGGAPSSQTLLTADIPVDPRPLPATAWLLSLGSPHPLVILALLGGLALLASASVAVWAATRNLGRKP